MKFNLKKIGYLLLAAVMLIGVVDAGDAYARKSSKASTSQSSKSKKKSKKNKNKNSSSKKSKSSKGKNSRKKGKSSSRSKKSKRYSKSRRNYTPKRRHVSQYRPAPDPVLNDSLTLAVNEAVLKWVPSNLNPGGLRVNAVRTDSLHRNTKVSLNENFTYLPVTQEFINSLQKEVKRSLPEPFSGYPVTLTVSNHPLSYYITKVDKLPEKYRTNVPFVVAREPWVNPSKGMEGDIVGLWSSHGRYFKSGSWQWQRPLLFETVEDLYTMSYILPYVVPMLENAGAYVMLPRERDTNVNEVIVDNDTNPDGQLYSQPYYKESTGSKPWETGEEEGFIYDLADFRDTENPFENGTYRQTTTVKSGKPSVAAWYADIPADGEYAVYVSYESLPNSTTDAHYTVNYSGGSKEFIVNQTMGGGTWIYLGTFPLEAGYSDTEPVVTLTNITEKEAGKLLTADAVKIGGGMGNIARSSHRSDIYYDPSTPEQGTTDNEADDEESDDESEAPTTENPDEGDDIVGDGQPDTSVPAEPLSATQQAQSSRRQPVFRTSGMPRFVEGARYWLHWAGAPESVYSPYHGSNDYKDDYTNRGHWINWLAGGSRVIPDADGLGIPIDVCLALHSDAGKRNDDSFVGTLGIYYTNGGDVYDDGTPRINSRMLTDMVMRQITGDIRQTYEPRWTRRSMWDKSYVEARVPEVPTTLIELMSHQNFADMQYGLDPGFRFTVGRAIYKALGRFMAERKDRKFVVQPLPVSDFAIQKVKKHHYRLSWSATPDPIEPTASPKKYIVLERSGDELGFHKIGETHNTHFDVHTSDNEIHSFRIIAANEGGISFDSETLALREGTDAEKPVMIVNGFTRISGPAKFSEGGQAGFRSEEDFGVPYLRDISFTGHQYDFRRGSGNFGLSRSDYATKVIAGNTFDYPYVHGEALAKAGYGFVSSSASAVAKGDVKLNDYKTVDLILGKQKRTTVGNGKSGVHHEAFSEEMQKRLGNFLSKGGNLLVSGQYVASDVSKAGNKGADFAEDVLGIALDSVSSRNPSGRVEITLPGRNRSTAGYSNTLNDKTYIVERPDAIVSTGGDARQVMTLEDSGAAAGLFSKKGKGRRAVFSIPLEAITDPAQRAAIIKAAMQYFENR